MSLRFKACKIKTFTLCLPSSTPQPKERRKGKKEIHRDNLETLAFYRKFSIAGTVSGWSVMQSLCRALWRAFSEFEYRRRTRHTCPIPLACSLDAR